MPGRLRCGSGLDRSRAGSFVTWATSNAHARSRWRRVFRSCREVGASRRANLKELAKRRPRRLSASSQSRRRRGWHRHAPCRSSGAACRSSRRDAVDGDQVIWERRYFLRALHSKGAPHRNPGIWFRGWRVVHLFERDCSLQRRFQKVIQDFAAPICRIGYETVWSPPPLRCPATAIAGRSVEYIVDASTFDFYFLEMNTRIQVEHPVTEMVTGVDLVAIQIDLARGRLAVMRQDALTQHGHAIEARLYAENPAKKFLVTGPARTLRATACGSGACRLRLSRRRHGDAVLRSYGSKNCRSGRRPQ